MLKRKKTKMPGAKSASNANKFKYIYLGVEKREKAKLPRAQKVQVTRADLMTGRLICLCMFMTRVPLCFVTIERSRRPSALRSDQNERNVISGSDLSRSETREVGRACGARSTRRDESGYNLSGRVSVPFESRHATVIPDAAPATISSK